MSLTRASLRHYLRAHLPVAAGVAIAVTVLAGALLVDASVRASLEALSRQRVGLTDTTISTATSFSGRLGAAMAIAAPDAIAGTTSLIAVTGSVSHGESGRTAVGVPIYGVDQTFWTFHGVPPVALAGLEAAVSERLAREIGVGAGDPLIIQARGPSDIPLATLPGRRDDAGARLRVTMIRALEPDRMGEFALHPQQPPVAAIFVPLPLLQRELGWSGRVNTVLVHHAARAGEPGRGRPPVDAVRQAWLAGAALPDFGVRIRRVPGDRVMALEGLGGVIDPAIVARVLAALQRLQRPGVPALAYLTTAIRAGDRTVPYSTVSAIDLDAYNRLSVPAGPPAPGTDAMSNGDPLVRGSLEIRVGRGGSRVGRVQVTEAGPRPRADAPADEPPRTPADPAVVGASEGPLWLNEWTAADLGARPGDPVQLEYDVWTDRGGLEPRQATFTLQGVVPMMRIGGDRTLIPDYPGIATARDLSAWRPSFPVDLARVRPLDEAYWDQWRTAPKAIIPLELGQRLWASRFGEVSSIRFALRDAEAVAAAVRAEVSSHVVVRAAGHEVITGAAGTTALGRLFLGFSVLLLVAALAIVYLCTALGVEQRAAEVGLMATVGFPASRIRRAFFTEGAVVLLVGVAVGVAGAVGYAAILLLGLRTWWVDAVETTSLRLHLDPVAWALGAAAAVPLALLAIWMGTGTLARRSPGGLLPVRGAVVVARRSRDVSFFPALALAIASGGLLLAAGTGTLGRTLGFFGAAAALLGAGLLAFDAWVRRRASGSSPPQVTGLWGLGITHAAWRPARTVCTVSLIAITTFVLLIVGGWQPAPAGPGTRASGAGGFALLAESAAPLMHDPNTPAGQAGLGLEASEMHDVRVVRLRLRSGDEASRRTRYWPRNPRIAGVVPEDLEGRFTFADAGATPPGTSTWRLLDQPGSDDLVPAIVDQGTLTHVLQLGVGDVFWFAPDGSTPVGFRIVASLADSVLQSEIIIGESAFGRLFPRDEGYRIWLVDVPEARAADLAGTLMNRLASASVAVVDTHARQASYRRADSAYRAAFQALGALGLLLGMGAVGAVVARNVLERQREWRWLRVVGYRPGHLRRLVIAEAAVMIVSGVVLGTVSAAVAAAPALVEGARPLPLRDIVLVILTLGAAGLAAALVALRTVTGRLTVRALKSE